MKKYRILVCKGDRIFIGDEIEFQLVEDGAERATMVIEVPDECIVKHRRPVTKKE